MTSQPDHTPAPEVLRGPGPVPQNRDRLSLAGEMTAKEQLRELVDELSEVEAAEALDLLAARGHPDSLSELLANAPLDDEPVTAQEEALVQEARDEIARGELIPADEIRREFG